MTSTLGEDLKRQTEALVKAVGVEASCAVTGRSKATLGRYYSQHEEHAKRFIPVDVLAALESAAGTPIVTRYLAQRAGMALVPQSHAADLTPEAVAARSNTVFTELGRLMMNGGLNGPEGRATLAKLRGLQAELVALEQSLVQTRVTTTDPTE